MFYVKGAQRGVYSSYRACLHATSDTKLRNGFDCEAPGIYCVTKRVAHPPVSRGWKHGKRAVRAMECPKMKQTPL